MGLQSSYTWLVHLDDFISCSTLLSVRTLSLGVVVGNDVGDDLGDGVAGVVVDGFDAGV